MNINKLFFVCLAALFSFVACDDMDAPETTQPVQDYALYNPLDGTSYTLDERNAAGAFETFLWGASTIADEVNYSVEFSADDFVTSSSLSAGTTTALKASIGDMIPVFRTINVPADVMTEVQVRVIANALDLADTTTTLTLNIKRYGLADELWYIQGTATGDQLVALDYDGEVDEYPYSTTQDLVAGEFFLIDTDGNTVGQSALATGLVADGTGIAVANAGDYTYSFDLDMMKYEVNQNETWYIQGTATGEELIELTYENTLWTGQVSLVEGSYVFVEKYGAVYGLNADSTLVLDGSAIDADTDGSYVIELDIPNATYTMELAEFPAQVFITGSALGGWDWASDYEVEMVPVAADGASTVFWAIAYLEGGNEAKFSTDQTWDNSFGVVAGGDGSFGPQTKGGENLIAPATSGYYMIVVDFETGEILLTEAEVYAMGNTVGSWDSYNAAAKFSIDNDTQEFSLNYEFASDELRLYAAAQWDGVDWLGDWWRSEFIFFDAGKIEYRGAGGDQERNVIDAGNQTITLSFKTGDASIAAN